jgi:archaellum component FlaC
MDYGKLKKAQLVKELVGRDTELSDKSTELDTLKEEFEGLSEKFSRNADYLEQTQDALKSLNEEFSTISSDLDIVTEIELRESQFIKVLCTAIGVETAVIIIMLLAIIL